MGARTSRKAAAAGLCVSVLPCRVRLCGVCVCPWEACLCGCVCHPLRAVTAVECWCWYTPVLVAFALAISCFPSVGSLASCAPLIHHPDFLYFCGCTLVTQPVCLSPILSLGLSRCLGARQHTYTALAAALLVAVCLHVDRGRVSEESIRVIPNIGVQLSTQYCWGSATKRVRGFLSNGV